MALFYTQPKNPKPQEKTPHLTLDIQSLDYQGLGVAKLQGKTWFVENALPDETVQVRVVEEKRQYGRAVATNILRANPERQSPQCAVYQACGGCQSQHIPLEMQRLAKQQALFSRLAKLQPQGLEFMPMIVGEGWQYRRRVRLSLNVNPKTKQLEMGFRQKSAVQIVNVSQCDVLEPALDRLLPKLRTLLNQFSQPKLLGHIELTAADNGVAMLLRHRQNLSEKDRTLLLAFAEQERLMLFVQDDAQIQQVFGEPPFYRLGELSLQFDIRDFIQINRVLNQQMVATALDWLEPESSDNVLDLFCGMGNFTLPISQLVQTVVGVEGVAEMVAKARKNAEQNGCQNVQFEQGNLDQPFLNQPWATVPFNKILLDPPRSGAAFAIDGLCQLQAEKILYISCNPATLVRDAEKLLQSGYCLRKVAMIDMFPHTGHLESISLFEKK
ncbi:23S rRNA (uracil(1939)-C(5))-methyltransferase RlmD [Lonepinella sp. BR2474]|uniref:23S rRNA (uracil(1939)-C(5))-methyltransferase RlmD n=1 Tax=Lonepinella sp. BR2474 TaxID=3434548 RepID=UPI003F6E081F